MIHLEPCKKEDYKFVYDLTFDFFKTNLNVTYVKMETFDEFVRRAFVPDDKNYIIKNENNERVGYGHINSSDVVGMFVSKGFHNKGIGTEAINMILKKNPRDRFFVTIHNNNKQSISMCKKLGFVPKGTVYEKIK